MQAWYGVQQAAYGQGGNVRITLFLGCISFVSSLRPVLERQCVLSYIPTVQVGL